MKATIARFLSGILAGVATFLVAKGLPADLAAEVTTGLVGATTALVYGIGHKLLRGFGLDDEPAG